MDKGYMIKYADANGNTDVTFYGFIDTNIKGLTEMEAIRLMFFNAHPCCTLYDIIPCTLSEFQKVCKLYS